MGTTFRILALTICLGLLARTSAACVGNVTLTVDPPFPATGDVVRVLVEGEDPDLCGPDPTGFRLDGAGRVVLEAEAVASPCVAPIPDFLIEFELPPLDPGPVEIVFDVVNDSPECEYPPLEVEVRGFGPVAPDDGPGATLLFPYFEVDLSDPAGRTTILTIGNTSGFPTLAHAALWTDWGLPSYSFDIHLEGHEVRVFNLRHFFDAGLAPEGGDGAPQGCADPLVNPPLDAAALAELRARHSGEPAADGLCHGSGRRGEGVATGFLTVDVARRCSGAGLAFPGDSGYFGTGGRGLAGNRNVLWGEYLFFDNAGERVEGLEAVALPADADRWGEGPTFYEWVRDDGDDRSPLPYRWRARFLNGGGFDASTELIVWTGGHRLSLPAPMPCGEVEPARCDILILDLATESGAPAGEVFVAGPQLGTASYVLGGPEIPVGAAFGSAEIDLSTDSCLASPPLGPLQLFVAPLTSARGRFGYGLRATPLP